MSDLINRSDALIKCYELKEARRKWDNERGRGEMSGIDAAMCVLHCLPSAQPDVTDKNVGDMMSRLDTAISNAAHILDALMAYRNIVDSGDCNRCGKKKTCEYVPNLGQLVRYNCPFYEQEGEG